MHTIINLPPQTAWEIFEKEETFDVNSQMVLAAATTSRSRLNGVSNTALNEQQLPSHCQLPIANCQLPANCVEL
jgi:hypothetical protein